MIIEIGDRVKSKLVKAHRGDGECFPMCTVIDEDIVEYAGEETQILNVQSDAGGSCEIFASSVFYREPQERVMEDDTCAVCSGEGVVSVENGTDECPVCYGVGRVIPDMIMGG